MLGRERPAGCSRTHDAWGLEPDPVLSPLLTLSSVLGGEELIKGRILGSSMSNRGSRKRVGVNGAQAPPPSGHVLRGT